jgi:hypothetical protein
MTSQILEVHPMKTDQPQETAPLFAQMVSVALGRWKKRLQRYYLRAYPDSGEIINHIINEEEAKAWEISFFPHLILPDLVDARIRQLGLQPAEARHDTVGLSHDSPTTELPKTAFALCGHGPFA